MSPLLDLADVPVNGPLLDFLRSQAVPPSGPDDYVLGRWQQHTHPDLADRLAELGGGCPLSAAYGVAALARDGVAAVVALGTDLLATRTDRLPAGLLTLDRPPHIGFLTGDWHAVHAWQSGLPSEAGRRLLEEAVAGALRYAGSLARPVR